MTTNLQLAGRVARHVSLRSISLRSATIKTSFDPDTLPDEIELDQAYRANLESKEGGRVVILVDFKFFARTPGEEGPVEIMSMDAAYALVYELRPDAEIEDHCFEYFAEVNGPYNAWPYWRELVQTATGRTGMAGVTVPVFHPRPREVSEEELGGKREPEAAAQS